MKRGFLTARGGQKTTFHRYRYPPVVNFKNIRLVFLPPNTTSVLEPMHQGIIKSLKVKFRKRLVLKIVNREEQDKELNISVLDAIRMLEDSWNDGTEVTIRNCFRHAGFKIANELDEANNSPEANLDEWGAHTNARFSPEQLVSFAEADKDLMTSDVPIDEQIAESIINAEKTDDAQNEADDSEEVFKINNLFETFKNLSQHEREEAIHLIKSLHTRSMRFMLNNCHQASPSQSITTDDDTLVSDAMSLISVSDDGCEDPSTYKSNRLELGARNTMKSVPVFHMQDTSPENVHKSTSGSSVQSTESFMISESSEYVPPTSNGLLTNYNTDVPMSAEMKELLASCKIVLLDNPAIDSNVIPRSEKEISKLPDTLSDQLQKSDDITTNKHDTLSDQLQKADDITTNKHDTRKEISKKSIVLRSAEKVKKKAISKFIFPSDSSGLSILNQARDALNAECTTNISLVSKNSKYIVSCWFCKRSFKLMNNLNAHSCCVSIKEKSDVGQRNYVYECLLCRITFLRLGHLRKHLDCHNRNVCRICDFRFARQNTLCQHMKTVHNFTKPHFHCKHCKKKFSNKNVLYHHLKIHANGKHICKECGDFFETEAAYFEHLEIHVRERNFSCKQCNKFFERKQQYEQHLMGHKRHVCSLCNVSFPTKRLWQKHQVGIHGSHLEVKKHECNVCQKTFLRPIHLRLHLRTHTGEKPALCFQCGKNFSNARTLAMHMKTPSHLKHVEGYKGVPALVDKPFLCAVCGARFFRQQSLSRHTKQIHGHKTSLKCPHCEYETKCEANLKRHVMLHTGEKRYICEKCGSSFHAMTTLNEHHAYVHSEKRSFSCSLCSKSFKGKSGLQRHMRIHSEVRPYKCHCNRAYKRMSHLKRHMLNAHQVVLKSKLRNLNSNPATSKENLMSQNSSTTLSTDTGHMLKVHTSVAELTSLLNTNSFNVTQNEIHRDGSTYGNLITTPNDGFLVLPSGDVNISFMSNNYHTLNIPSTTSDLLTASSVPSNILPLSPPSSLSISSEPQSSVDCTESALEQQYRSRTLHDEPFVCTKVDLSTSSSFPNYSISDTNHTFTTLPMTTFLMSMEQLSGNESLHGIEACSTKQLFDENAALLGISQFSSTIHLNENKGLTTCRSIPSSTDPLWDSSNRKRKSSDPIIENGTLLSCTAVTIGSSTSKTNDSLQDDADVFSESLLFHSEPSVGCSLGPDPLQPDELDTLSSHVYTENVKLLSIS